jgi:hypothetical protein
MTYKEKEMKVLGFMLSIAVLSLSAAAVSQSDAQNSFDKLKALAGEWEGAVTTVPPEPTVEGKVAHVTLRVTSLGNALMHEMKIAGRPDDPITMLYLDEDRLLLTHYCDAGNRPRMLGKMVPDGKTVEFNLLEVAGSTQYGHMHNVAFTLIDSNHHAEEWTFMGKGSVRAHFDLQRKN